MDTPGAVRPPWPWTRLVTVGAAGLAAALVVGLLIRVSGEPQAAAQTVPQAPAVSLPSSFPTTSPTAQATPAMLPAGQDVLVLGDSLALSTYAWLADLLPDRYVSWEAQVGRTTAQARVALADRLATGEVPPVIVVSSGTNDVDAGTLQREASRILDLAGPHRCVVWADVVRPSAFGDGTAAANAALAAAWRGHDNVVPVRWTSMIDEHSDWLTSDGIHPVEAGSVARAKAFAAAVLSCSPLDPGAPRASQQYLPQASFLAPGGGSVPGVGGCCATPTRSSGQARSPVASTSRSAGGSAPSATATMGEQPTPTPPPPSDSPVEPGPTDPPVPTGAGAQP